MVIIGFSIKKTGIALHFAIPVNQFVMLADVMSFGFQCFFSYIFSIQYTCSALPSDSV